MQKETLLPILENLTTKLKREIKTLNWGGCGLFAQYIGEKLTELNIPFTILLCDFNPDCYKNKKYNISNALNNKPFDSCELSANHFIVEVCGILFDGHAIYKSIDDLGDRLPRGEYTLIEMTVANELGFWNSSYDRKQNNILRETINLELSLL